MRIEPQMGDHNYKTYALYAPASSHRRKATCEEYGCLAFKHGWAMGFDVTDPDKAKALKWVRLHSGLKYTIQQVGNKVTLTFPAGQQCLDQRRGLHTVPLDREPFYVVRHGDWRTERRYWEPQQRSEGSWLDDFGAHQQTLADRLAQG